MSLAHSLPSILTRYTVVGLIASGVLTLSLGGLFPIIISFDVVLPEPAAPYMMCFLRCMTVLQSLCSHLGYKDPRLLSVVVLRIVVANGLVQQAMYFVR